MEYKIIKVDINTQSQLNTYASDGWTVHTMTDKYILLEKATV